MVLIGFGSILMAATGNTTIQLAVPDQLRGRVMSVYTTVFARSVPIGGLAMGAIASALGRRRSRSRSAACCTLVVGLGRVGLGSRAARFDSVDSRRPEREPSVGIGPRGARRTRADGADRRDRPDQPSTAPKTSAALSPPNPNDVDSTRR